MATVKVTKTEMKEFLKGEGWSITNQGPRDPKNGVVELSIEYAYKLAKTRKRKRESEARRRQEAPKTTWKPC